MSLAHGRNGRAAMGGAARGTDASARDLGFIRSVRMREGADLSKMFALVLFLLFVVFLLVAIAVGTRIYGGLAQNQAQLADERLATSLISNDLRANDAFGNVRVGKGPQGPSLEMAQSFESGGYVTRIYQFNGQILQEYVMADADFDPDNAIVLVRSERFDVTIDGNLVTVATDQGTSQTCLRSMPRVS